MTGATRRSSTASWCFALLGIVAGVAMAQEPGPARVIEIPASALTIVDNDPASSGIARTGNILLPADLFEDPPPQGEPPVVVVIPVGDGTVVELEETHRRVRDGRTIIFGRDRTQDHSSFYFIREDGQLRRGEIERVDQVITFTGPQSADDFVTFKMVIWQPSDIPEEREPNEAAAPSYDPGDERAIELLPADPPPGLIEINLMVVYTPMAASMVLADLGEDITDTIDFVVWLAGLRMEDQAGVKLNLVHVQEVNYVEAASIDIDLDRLECPCDHKKRGIGNNHLNDVFVPWKSKQVDVVSMWIHSATGESGFGNIMSNVTTDWAPRAAHVVSWDGAVARKSFDHELGHQFGARHDRKVDTKNNLPYAFNHGYVNLNTNLVTIMAYTSSCPPFVTCTRRGIWSDPDYAPVGSWGVALGPSAADNARTLESSATTVSLFNTKHNLVGCCIKYGNFFHRKYRPGPCP